MVGKPEPRYVTPEAAAKLRVHFNLPLDDYDDHWETMRHFGGRTEEFLTYYATASDLTEDDKFALMAIIICSFDDRIGTTGDDPRLADRVRKQLAADFALHEWTIYCWSRWEIAPDLDPDPRPHPPRHALGARRLARAQGAPRFGRA